MLLYCIDCCSQEDGGWAREGNRTFKLSQFDSQREIADGLRPILEDLFANPARPTATGVQIQPSLVALQADCPEYRGFWIEGKLITIVSASLEGQHVVSLWPEKLF